SAEVFCEMVVASIAIADYARASQWMDEADRTDRIVCFPGCCRVHRTTVMRHRGEWDGARTSATTARAEVRGVEAFHEGMVVAEVARERLSTVASQLGTNAAIAADASVGGVLMRERGNVSGAARELERAVRHWHAVGDPYEVARTRVQLAGALEVLGDTTSAR